MTPALAAQHRPRSFEPAESATMDWSPYRRRAAWRPRFLCLGCYRTVSAVPGDCPGCGVGLLDLGDEGVRGQLHEEAERRLQERSWREELPVVLGGVVMSLAGLLALGALGSPLERLLGLLVLVPLLRALMLGHSRLRPGTARATFAARRLRLAGELGADVRVALSPPPDRALARHAGEDPSSMDLPRLLRWLGVRLDPPARS